MKKIRGLPLFLLILVLTSLACTINVGGPDYSSLPPIPVSGEAAQSIQAELQRAIEAAAQTGVIVSMGVDANGQPQIDVASADFGPFPAPEGLKDAITAMVREAYTGSLGPVATGLRIETISIANGVMTVTGRIR